MPGRMIAPPPIQTSDPISTGLPNSCFRRANEFQGCIGVRIWTDGPNSVKSPIFTLHPHKPEYAWVKAGIINDPAIVKPAYEIWTKDKVTWATANVAESFEESRSR